MDERQKQLQQKRIRRRRNELLMKCKQLKPRMDLNKALKELDQVVMHLGADNRYHAMQNCSERQYRLLEALQVQQDNLDYVAEYENRRRNKEAVSPVQTLSGSGNESHTDPSATKKIQGIPEGSKAKGSSAKLRAAQSPKRRGRPPKNPQPAEQLTTAENRKPGAKPGHETI